MTESADLERRYLRLLASYPQPFRREHADEMLAVLMAGAPQGRRRPGLRDAADVLASALRMRLSARRRAEQRDNQRWTDGLALFSVVAPLFVVVVAILEVAQPHPSPFVFLGSGSIGLSLLRVPFFDIAVGLQVMVTVLALLGRRRLTMIAMAASVLYWAGYWVIVPFGISSVPDVLQLLAAGAYILGIAALAGSPGPPRGRQLVNWRHWVVLLPAAGLVEVLWLITEARNRFGWEANPSRFQAPGISARLLVMQPAGITGYLVIGAALVIIAAGLALALKVNRYLLLLLAAMFYSYAMQLAAPWIFGPGQLGPDLLREPTPGHLAVLFGPPLLLACACILAAVAPDRPRAAMPAGPQA
jgi:hypothetical protein